MKNTFCTRLSIVIVFIAATAIAVGGAPLLPAALAPNTTTTSATPVVTATASPTQTTTVPRTLQSTASAPTLTSTTNSGSGSGTNSVTTSQSSTNSSAPTQSGSGTNPSASTLDITTAWNNIGDAIIANGMKPTNGFLGNNPKPVGTIPNNEAYYNLLLAVTEFLDAGGTVPGKPPIPSGISSLLSETSQGQLWLQAVIDAIWLYWSQHPYDVPEPNWLPPQSPGTITNPKPPVRY